MITCIFDELPSEIVLDAVSRTTLQEEFLIDENGNLSIAKVYKNGKGAGSYISNCLHPSAKNAKGLLLKKMMN